MKFNYGLIFLVKSDRFGYCDFNSFKLNASIIFHHLAPLVNPTSLFYAYAIDILFRSGESFQVARAYWRLPSSPPICSTSQFVIAWWRTTVESATRANPSAGLDDSSTLLTASSRFSGMCASIMCFQMALYLSLTG